MPAETEAVLGMLVTVALYVKEDGLTHQPRLVESDPAGAVGHVSQMIDRLQFDQRDTASRCSRC